MSNLYVQKKAEGIPPPPKPVDADVFVSVRGKTLGFKRRRRLGEPTPDKRKLKPVAVPPASDDNEENRAPLKRNRRESAYYRKKSSCLFSRILRIGRGRFVVYFFEKDGDSIELQVYDPETCRNWTVILSELELRAFLPDQKVRYRLAEVGIRLLHVDVSRITLAL